MQKIKICRHVNEVEMKLAWLQTLTFENMLESVAIKKTYFLC